MIRGSLTGLGKLLLLLAEGLIRLNERVADLHVVDRKNETSVAAVALTESRSPDERGAITGPQSIRARRRRRMLSSRSTRSSRATRVGIGVLLPAAVVGLLLFSVGAYGYLTSHGTGGGLAVVGQFTGPLDHFVISPDSGPETAGTAFGVTVTAKDADDHTVIGYHGKVQFTSNDTSATLPADYTFKVGDAGVHYFTGISFGAGGTSQTVIATDSVISTATGTGTFDVAKATPSISVVGPGVSDSVSSFASLAREIPTIRAEKSGGGNVAGQAIDPSTIIATLDASSSPNAGGTISFFEFGPEDAEPSGSCAGGEQIGPDVTISGDGTYSPSDGFTPAHAGTYWLYATYSGDPGNQKAASACAPGKAQKIVVAKASPSVATTTPAAVTVGTSVSGVVTITGGAKPTGNVVVTLYSDPTCQTSAGSASAGLSGGTADSLDVPTTVAGTFYWQAAYSGDDDNEATTTVCGAETVAVEKATPSIATRPSANVTVGQAVSDDAELSDAMSPTGSIVFTLYSDADCTIQAFSSSAALDGTAATSGDLATLAAGTYYWKASYGGDDNNDAVTGPCGAGYDTVTVSLQGPTITTTSSPGVPGGGVVSDEATLTGGASPTGTISFTLYDGPDCKSSVFSSSSPIVGSTVTSPDSGALAPGTYYWQAVYTGDANNGGFTTLCGIDHDSVVVTAPASS